jgi:hypothetical protein
MIGLSRHLTYVEISDPTPPDARGSVAQIKVAGFRTYVIGDE